MLKERAFGDKEVQRKCGGVCCKRFYLPYSPEEITKEWHNYLQGKPYRFNDIGTIGPMLKHLESIPNDNAWRDDKRSHYYTCNYIDEVSGLCLIYSHRPHMCWAYPYGGTCNYHGCGDKPFMRRWVVTRPLWLAYNWVRTEAKGRYGAWRVRKQILDKLPSTFDGKLVELGYTKKEEIKDGEKA